MNNSEKLQAALAGIRKRWMETHGGTTPQGCRSSLLPVSDENDDNADETRPVEAG